MISFDQIISYLNKHRKEWLEDYLSLLRIPSISAEPAYVSKVAECASWVEEYLLKTGLETERWATAGHPVVFGEDLSAGSDKPTLLIYGHYDVQPADPLELWLSHPFDPVIKDNIVYGRGAQDNKGQLLYTLLALQAVRSLRGSLPINVKVIIEGEEECGSPSLPELLCKKLQKVKADYLAVVDMGIPAPDIPAIALGCRGIITMDITVTGASSDLHSGTHGGVVYNANHALVELLAKLRNSNGEVTVPGFYDDVEPLSVELKKLLYMDFDAESYKKTFGAEPNGGERGYSAPERAGLRPTVEINGITGGYTGDGFKTVIPAKASAKLSCRLVPRQKPVVIAELVAQFLKSMAPEGISVDVSIHHGGESVRSSVDSPLTKAFAKAYSDLFQQPCRYLCEGGSIPIVAQLAEACGGEFIMVGLGLDDDGIHAPNEHFGLDRFEKGVCLIARTLEELGDHG